MCYISRVSSMFPTICVAFVAVVFLLPGDVRSRPAVDTRVISYKENLEALKSMTCNKPRPVVIPVEYVYEDTFTPEWVVLNRCFQSGCCSIQSQTCAPLKRECVEIEFRGGNGDMVKLSFDNHLECHCAELTETLKWNDPGTYTCEQQ